MKLILFRHGIAVDRDLFIQKKMQDGLRPLTGKGREKTMAMAAFLQKRLDHVDLLVSSPLLRAQETASIIGEKIPFDQALESTELVPEAPPQAFASWLKSHAAHANSVIAVGHEPQLSVFASWMLAGVMESFLDFKKSGILWLEVESFDHLGPKSADLKWMQGPKQL